MDVLDPSTKYHSLHSKNTSPLPYDILVTGIFKTVFKRPDFTFVYFIYV